ncbi:MAG: hypothetical protein V3U19_10585 [Thermodesulfobacteriota bacterium]
MVKTRESVPTKDYYDILVHATKDTDEYGGILKLLPDFYNLLCSCPITLLLSY